jgi:tRNA (cmo5U34)-methyltransferase
MTNFFNKTASSSYDEANKILLPISENMHFLIRLILKDLPEDARILCVGVGTGAEIFSLAEVHPQWSFVGVDPSPDMLEVCRQRLTETGIADRCQLIEGYVQDVEEGEQFDAVLSILVGHFVQKEERQAFYQHMCARLKKGGCLVDTEISCDFDAKDFPQAMRNWGDVQILRGASEESIQKLPEQLQNTLAVLPPTEIERMLTVCGIEVPVHFFQAFMIHGWYGLK